MDQDSLVNEQTDSGRLLIDELRNSGFEVVAGFWAKPTDDARWYLFVVSPVVDQQGLHAALRLVHPVVRRMSNSWIDPLDLRLLATSDPMAQAVQSLIAPKNPDGPFAVSPAKPYPGPTRVPAGSLGGYEIEGGYIYPPPVPTPTA